MPFTEETVYNSNRHVAAIVLLALSDAHAVEEVTFLFYKLIHRIQRRGTPGGPDSGGDAIAAAEAGGEQRPG